MDRHELGEVASFFPGRVGIQQHAVLAELGTEAERLKLPDHPRRLFDSGGLALSCPAVSNALMADMLERLRRSCL
jgi:hypothetical protein